MEIIAEMPNKYYECEKSGKNAINTEHQNLVVVCDNHSK